MAVFQSAVAAVFWLLAANPLDSSATDNLLLAAAIKGHQPRKHSIYPASTL